jgi:sortase A
MIITLRRQRLRLRLRWARRALFMLSAVLLGYVALVFVQAEISQSKADQYLVRRIPQGIPQGSPHAAPEPAHPLAEGDILGRIRIPRLGLSAVILEGTKSRTLRLGVGHIRGTAIPGKHGNTAIAGHRDIFFRSLKGIHADDEIQLETEDGSNRYLVDWARVVAPEDISVLDSTSESALTLVTCYPFYFIGAAPKRFVVRAHQVPTATPERRQAELPGRESRPATPFLGEMQ